MNLSIPHVHVLDARVGVKTASIGLEQTEGLGLRAGVIPVCKEGVRIDHQRGAIRAEEL